LLYSLTLWVIIMVNKKLLEKEYEKELSYLKTVGISPVGINSHLESFEAFLEWRQKYSDLFDNNDAAKDLI